MNMSVTRCSNSIDFVPLTMDDLPLIHRWRNNPWVAEFYGDPDGISYEAVVEKYAPRIGGGHPTRCFIITCNGAPIGHIQTYLWRDYPDYAQHLDLDEEAASLDVFIGEEDYIHKGLGSIILVCFLQRVVFADKSVESCVITPEERNSGAIRAYEKAGFKFLRVINHPGEPSPVCVMRIGRDDISC